MDKLANSIKSLSLMGRQLFSSEMGKGIPEEPHAAALTGHQKRGRNEVPTGSLHKELRPRETMSESESEDDDDDDDDDDDENDSEERKTGDSDEDKAIGTEYLHSEGAIKNPNLATVPGAHHPLSHAPASSKGKRGGWTPEQDEALRRAVERHDGKNWKNIAKEVPGNRTHIQCLQRWGKVLKPGLVKGPWTEEEDDLLRYHVPLEPRGNWVAVAEHIPGRTAKQCRERWSLCLDPAIRKDPWSPEEDELLLQLHDMHGNAWATIAKHLSGRTENATKSRFKSIARKRDREWTAQEDATIIRGKAEEKKWSAIAAMMPRSKRTKHAVKTRWKELMKLNPALKRFDSGSTTSSNPKSSSGSSLMSMVDAATAHQQQSHENFARGLSQVLVYQPGQYLPPPVPNGEESSPPHMHVLTESEDPLDENGGASSLAQLLPTSLSSDKLLGGRLLQLQHQNESFEEWLAKEAGGINNLPVFASAPVHPGMLQRGLSDDEQFVPPPPWAEDIDFSLV